MSSVRIYDGGSPSDVDLSACVFDGSDTAAFAACLEAELASNMPGNYQAQVYAYWSTTNNSYNFSITFYNKHNPLGSRGGIERSDSSVTYSPS